MGAVSIYKCLVNGSINAGARDAVTSGLTRVNRDRFGIEPSDVTVEFIEVADGLWFTAGEPSRASMVLGTVPEGTSQDVRIAVMDDIAHLFSDATGADYYDVMVVAADPNNR